MSEIQVLDWPLPICRQRVSPERLKVRRLLVEYMRSGVSFSVRDLYRVASEGGGDWNDADYTLRVMRKAEKIDYEKTKRNCVWKWKKGESA